MDCASVETLPAANPVRGSITMLLWGGSVCWCARNGEVVIRFHKQKKTQTVIVWTVRAFFFIGRPVRCIRMYGQGDHEMP